ncbi:MAG: DUF4065 domain-containing protein [Bacteroidales bacterium]|nr:DUF4065 domain-containing protein [Bacteroidales bacterium]
MEATNTLSKIGAIEMAQYILKHYGPMSHLKLQKLLFYCDAYHLAYFDEELISEQFEAWVHGPVCRVVFDSLKDKSLLYSDIQYSDIGVNEDYHFSLLSTIQQEFVNSILLQLSPWTSLELENATHCESPWIEARKGFASGDKCHVAIDKELTKQYYKKDLA